MVIGDAPSRRQRPAVETAPGGPAAAKSAWSALRLRASCATGGAWRGLGSREIIEGLEVRAAALPVSGKIRRVCRAWDLTPSPSPTGRGETSRRDASGTQKTVGVASAGVHRTPVQRIVIPLGSDDRD